MSSDQLVQRLFEQVEGSHYSFIRFVGRVSRHEWDWAPDAGIQSARDVVANLVREEVRIAKRLAGDGGAAEPALTASDLATPAAAAATLRALREATLGAVRRVLPGAGEEEARRLAQSAVSLAQLDAHALGEIVMLQRLIDPSRATLSPR